LVSYGDYAEVRDELAAAFPRLVVRGRKPAGDALARDGSVFDVWLMRDGADEARERLVWSRRAQPQPRQPEPGEVSKALLRVLEERLRSPGSR
jgi:hypothetical protein